MFRFTFQHKIPNQTIISFTMYDGVVLNLYQSESWLEPDGIVQLIAEECLLFTNVWRGFRESLKG